MENNYFKLLRGDLAKLWGEMDIAKRFIFVVLIALTIVASTYFIMRSMEPNWTVLYTDLSQQDAIAVSESLKKGGYPFKLSEDKKAVLVPVEMQDELRIYVAENDLIQDSNPGFELLDNLQLGSTDFKNQLTKQRIFQGELTRSIEKINGIKKARVQIAEPERSVFQEQDELPSASVVLILQPGYKLKTNQVKAIKNLVAYSIPRMTPERVFITDQAGNSLTDEIEKSSSDIESFRSNFETQTAKKVQDVLDKIVGKGNATVQVSADIDFNTAKSTIESYTPVTPDSKQGVLTSEQTETEVYDNPNSSRTDTADSATSTTNKNLNYQKQRTAASYSVSKEVKQIIYAPGSVKRMTIAVAVNKILTEKEKGELTNLITTASGVNAERGDVVNISSLQFASIDEEKQAQEQAAQQYQKDSQADLIFNKILPLVVILILGIGALVVLSLFIKNMTGGGGSSGEYDEMYVPGSIYDERAQLLKTEVGDSLSVESLPELDAKLDTEFDKIKHDLCDTILSDPEEAAKILISYIKD